MIFSGEINLRQPTASCHFGCEHNIRVVPERDTQSAFDFYVVTVFHPSHT